MKTTLSASCFLTDALSNVRALDHEHSVAADNKETPDVGVAHRRNAPMILDSDFVPDHVIFCLVRLRSYDMGQWNLVDMMVNIDRSASQLSSEVCVDPPRAADSCTTGSQHSATPISNWHVCPISS